MLRSDTANILFYFENSNSNVARISQCQICRDRNHEALFFFLMHHAFTARIGITHRTTAARPKIN